MIPNAALIRTEAYQAHVVVDIGVVTLGVVLLLLLAIRYSNLNAKYLHLVIWRRSIYKVAFLLVGVFAVDK